jgi:hypothetical protein
MRRLLIRIAASAVILFLIPTGWSANAMTGPGPSKVETLLTAAAS